MTKASTRLLISALLASCAFSVWGIGGALAATNLAPTDTDIVAGVGAQSIPYYPGQHGAVAIGENAQSVTMLGLQELWLAMGQTNLAEYPAGIAIGENTFARTGSIQLGTHNYTGAMGNINVTNTTNKEAVLIGMTTIGTNSYNKGAYGTITGADSIITGNFDGSKENNSYGIQNFGANIVGSLNSIESKGNSPSAGIANSIVGVANRVQNANGALVFGAGNEIKNSIGDDFSMNMYTPFTSAQNAQESLMASVRNSSNGGGSVLAVGGANQAENVVGTQIIGLKINVKGTDPNNVIHDNIFIGKQLTGTDVTDVEVMGGYNSVSNSKNDILIGERRNLKSANDNVILGLMDKATDHTASGTVVLGHNAQATVNGSAALGEASIATVDKGKQGYDPKTKALSTETSATWQSTAAAVSVGDTANNITRQITGVAAGTQDTDAVNVAQLKLAVQDATGGVQPTVSEGDNITIEKTGDAATGYDYKISANLSGVATKDSGLKFGADSGSVITTKLNEQLNIKGGVTDTANLTDNNIGVVSDGTQLNVKLAKNLTNLETISVTKSISVGDTVNISSTGIDAGNTKITNVQDGNISSTSKDAVNGSQLYQYEQQTNTAITNIGDTVNDLSDRMDKVGAGAAALAALHPLDFDADDKWDFAVGYGHYDGAGAAAIGAFYRPNEDTMFSFGKSLGNGENMWNAGLSVKLGQGNHVSTSRTAMAKEMKDMRQYMLAMDKRLAAVEAQNQGLRSVLDLYKTKEFPDIPTNHWAYEYVAKLAGNGIIEGYPDGDFRGDRTMTRYEFAAMLYRAIEKGAALDGKLIKEFKPELERIRVDQLYPNSQKINRVRVIPGRG